MWNWSQVRRFLWEGTWNSGCTRCLWILRCTFIFQYFEMLSLMGTCSGAQTGLWMETRVYKMGRAFMSLTWRKICSPLYFPPSDSALPLRLPQTPSHPARGSLSGQAPAQAPLTLGACCRKRWGCHSHSCLLPFPLTWVHAAAAALPAAEASLCSVIPAPSEHSAAAGHLQPSHDFLFFSPRGWLSWFQGYCFPSHHRNTVSITSTVVL